MRLPVSRGGDDSRPKRVGISRDTAVPCPYYVVLRGLKSALRQDAQPFLHNALTRL